MKLYGKKKRFKDVYIFMYIDNFLKLLSSLVIFTAGNYCTVNKTMDKDIEQIKLSELLLLSESSVCQSPV
jgi:hypothetical protein